MNIQAYKPSFSLAKDTVKGAKLIQKGKLAAVLLAGGQGSRLGWEGPKGTYIFPTIGKSLFQLHCEKIQSACIKAKKTLELAIMCSEENVVSTKEFFVKNNFFLLPRENIHFFIQSSLPLLTKNNEPVKSNGKILYGSSGNGDFYSSFYGSDIFSFWREKNIEYLSIIPIDNPFAEIFDEELLGFHVREQNEVSLICVEKLEKEKLGVCLEKNGKLFIQEYMQPSLCQEKSYANTGVMIMDMAFVQKIAKGDSLPIHKIEKKLLINKKRSSVFKRERFIFDSFLYSRKVGALYRERKECFIPLKSKSDAKKIIGRLVKK